MSSSMFFNVNGKDITLQDVDPFMTLAGYLREKLRLTGTKIACSEGACGSCTVVLGQWDKSREEKPRYFSVNACIYPLYLVNGCFVITIEGIGTQDKIHQIQERMTKGHAIQCGFCSPGFIMSAYALLRMHPNPTIKQINQAIKGNLCRCTGYRPILESLYSFSSEGGGCCQGMVNGVCPCKEPNSPDEVVQLEGLTSFADFPAIDPSQELIFPPSLLNNKASRALHLKTAKAQIIAPTLLAEAIDLIKQHAENCTIVSTGVMTLLGERYKIKENHIYLSTWNISKLSNIKETENDVIIGSSTSISEFLNAVDTHCDAELAEPIAKLFDQFSSKQIMNCVSWVGSLFSKGASDFFTLAHGLNLTLDVASDKGVRSLGIEEFTENGLNAAEIITAITVPKRMNDVRLFTFKAGSRIGPDAPIVTIAAVLGANNFDFNSVRISVGASGKPRRLTKFEKSLKDRSAEEFLYNWSELSFLLEKDFLENASELQKNLIKGGIQKILKEFATKNTAQPEDKFKFTQIYKKVNNNAWDEVGRPISHLYADRSATGTAVYIDDIPARDLLHIAVLMSTEPHATIIKVDPSEALNQPDVVGYYDIKDIPHNGCNKPGTLPIGLFHDDTKIFAGDKVEYIGQPIGVIAARSLESARRAVTLVKVEYEKNQAIFTMEDAIAAKSYVCDPSFFGKEETDIAAALEKTDIVLEGELNIGGQEHMYMETQSALCVPTENGEMTVYSSTQAGTLMQLQLAGALGIPANKVTIRMKRIGGGFGAKCTQSIFNIVAAAVVSQREDLPASCVFSRYEDCMITGKRHPAKTTYKIGFSEEGQIIACHMKYYLDSGYSLDNSQNIMFVGCTMADTIYEIPLLRVEGYCLKTNKQSQTAFRGYGMPQATYFYECMIERIAKVVGKDIEQIRELNFRQKGARTMEGHPIQNEAMLDCWEELQNFTEFKKKRQEVNEFNRNLTSLKRGLGMTTVRWPLTHAGPFEQAHALIQIYMDGSVGISIGGCEMGQGLVVKCAQVASRVLEIPLSKINMLDASTDKTTNIPETGGSQGTDLHGKAVRVGCAKLKENLAPFLKDGKTWEEAVIAAYHNRIPLQVNEHIKIDRSRYGLEEGHPCYYTTGAACVIAEIDSITGDHKLLSVDIVMDVGESINPAIDIGQIEGAFMQGYGLMASEEVTWDNDGKLETIGLQSYKMPTISMVPREFRVKLLAKSDNYPEQVYSSKGIGEPPLLLGVASYAALRDAIEAHRRDINRKEWVQIDAPVTKEKILHFCN